MSKQLNNTRHEKDKLNNDEPVIEYMSWPDDDLKHIEPGKKRSQSFWKPKSKLKF